MMRNQFLGFAVPIYSEFHLKNGLRFEEHYTLKRGRNLFLVRFLKMANGTVTPAKRSVDGRSSVCV